jgi:hypothetical protein
MKKEIKELKFDNFCDKIDAYIDVVSNRVYFFAKDYLYKTDGMFLREIIYIDLNKIGYYNDYTNDLWYLLISIYPGSKLYLNPYKDGGIKTTVPKSLTEYLNI